MMSVNDMQSVYGGEAAIDGGTLPGSYSYSQ